MSCPNETPLDPRVRRTRKLLQNALQELAFERPFASISIQEIAERATVNRATFYAHFPDKQALLASVLEAEYQSFLHARFPDGLPALTPQNLTAVVAAIFEFFGTMVKGCPDSNAEAEGVVHQTLQTELECMFRAWLTKDFPREFAGHSVGTLASVLSWSVYGGAQRWSHGSRRRTAEEKARAIVDLLMPGVTVAV